MVSLSSMKCRGGSEEKINQYSPQGGTKGMLAPVGSAGFADVLNWFTVIPQVFQLRDKKELVCSV
jgi:hypothetical protein